MAELPVKMTSAPIDRVLAQALEFHQAGQLSEARKFYRKILAFVPDHADGLHLSGLADHAQGLNLQAVRSIARAIAVFDLNPVYYNNLGAIFFAQGLYAASAIVGVSSVLGPVNRLPYLSALVAHNSATCGERSVNIRAYNST